MVIIWWVQVDGMCQINFRCLSQLLSWYNLLGKQNCHNAFWQKAPRYWQLSWITSKNLSTWNWINWMNRCEYPNLHIEQFIAHKFRWSWAYCGLLCFRFRSVLKSVLLARYFCWMFEVKIVSDYECIYCKRAHIAHSLFPTKNPTKNPLSLTDFLYNLRKILQISHFNKSIKFWITVLTSDIDTISIIKMAIAHRETKKASWNMSGEIFI